MTCSIVFAPEAEAHLLNLHRAIASAASPQIAERYTEAIVGQCEKLNIYPERGTPRDDIRPGLRTLSFRRRVVIAYAVEPGTVTILGVFYGGQDFRALLREGPEQP